MTTDACSLCEDALTVLLSMRELSGLSLQTLDVATDDLLLEKYGPYLPVLRLTGYADLYWPFNAQDVIRWLDDGPG